MSFNTDEEESINKKIGKKKYLPFGTSTNQHHPYSEYVHLNNPQAQSFAKTLATAAIEKIEILNEKPKRASKRLLKSPSKSDPSSKSGDDNDKLDIPDAEGLEPCIKLGCQLILRALSDQQYANEIEREDIEDEYERLLIDLSEAEREISVADKKLISLNDNQRQLEQRNDQLLLKVEELETLKETQKKENSDLNNKIMVYQTEKSKLLRILEKSQKTLADAKWRKKKQEQDADAEAGLSLMGGSVISERPIKKMDRSLITSVSSIYSTSYNRLASSHVLDHIEQPLPVKTIPKFVIKELSSAPQHFDKYTKQHYKHLVDSGLKGWSRSMEGSLTTANINSPATFGSSFDTMGLSYDEYTQADHFKTTTSTVTAAATAALTRGSDQSQQHRLISSSTLSTTAASNRVGSLLKIRSSTNSIQLSKSTSKHKKNQIRLIPLEQNTSKYHSSIYDEDDDNSFQDPDGILKISASVLSPSSLSALSFDELSTSVASSSSTTTNYHHNRLDPVFYKEKHRTSWGRGNAIGKIRTSEVTWGMQTYRNNQLSMNHHHNKDDIILRKAVNNSIKNDTTSNEILRETVKSRSLTVYHPNMHAFKDSMHLQPTIMSTDSVDSGDTM